MSSNAYLPDGAEGLAILLWAADASAPQRLATPFFHAMAAAAMELPVEMYFSAASVQLLVPGVAEGLRASAFVDRSIAQTMHEAHAAGVRFFVCTDALHAQGLKDQPLIPAVSGHGGAVQFIARTLDARWRTLVF